MAVTARFKVSRVTPWGHDADRGEIEMTPDYANGKNKDWAEATPSGVCRLTISQPEVFKRFELGSEVEIEMKISNPSQFT